MAAHVADGEQTRGLPASRIPLSTGPVRERSASESMKAQTDRDRRPDAGFVTQALPVADPVEDIARQAGHAQLDTVLGYRREHDPLTGNAITRVGL